MLNNEIFININYKDVYMKKFLCFLLFLLVSVVLVFLILSIIVNVLVFFFGWEGFIESGFGNLVMNGNDDGLLGVIVFDVFELFVFDSGVNFFGILYDRFFINNNGNIIFNGIVSFFMLRFFFISN